MRELKPQEKCLPCRAFRHWACGGKDCTCVWCAVHMDVRRSREKEVVVIPDTVDESVAGYRSMSAAERHAYREKFWSVRRQYREPREAARVRSGPPDQ